MTRFLLNGTLREIAAPEPGRTVLEHLRLHERLTGTKEGCAEGDCGACTVVLGRKHEDGLKFEAVNACIMLARELDGCALVTAEGIAADGTPHPVQAAFVESHASQCGFCTPGFVMSLYAYAQTPAPADATRRREKIYDALAGNLCRCTGYRPIVDAAMALPARPDKRAASWRAMLDSLPAENDALAPKNFEDLAGVLASHPGAKLLAGGTDLGVGVAKYGQVPPVLVSLRRVAGLAEIEAGESSLIIGAMASYSQILPYLAEYFPAFAAMVCRLGSVQIRNLGTMGGNICNASPIGDSAPCLLALGAIVHLRSAAGERRMKLDEFFLAYRKTALAEGEFLRAIEIPYLQAGETMFTYKLAKRYDQDISTVAAAFVAAKEDDRFTHIRAAFGGMAATPKRAAALEAALRAGEDGAAALARDFQPLSDFRATAAYRMRAARNLVQKFLLESSNSAQRTDVWSL
jgi:xanthine dehydrogenase small subunit